MKGKYISVYVDSNILINYCNRIKVDCDALKYLFKKRRREVLFTSTLAIAQTIARLQTYTKKRKAYTSEQVVAMLEDVLPHFTIIDFTQQDIINALAVDCKDLEDCLHFIISRKRKCSCILTNNTKDFSAFNVDCVTPQLGVLKTKIQ
ncbi:MAG: PIN domain-containing protein [Bacteroidales bacterium]|nr:PIN domain-containing protein [Bacteroidales bacterium]